MNAVRERWASHLKANRWQLRWAIIPYILGLIWGLGLVAAGGIDQTYRDLGWIMLGFCLLMAIPLGLAVWLNTSASATPRSPRPDD